MKVWTHVLTVDTVEYETDVVLFYVRGDGTVRGLEESRSIDDSMNLVVSQ